MLADLVVKVRVGELVQIVWYWIQVTLYSRYLLHVYTYSEYGDDLECVKEAFVNLFIFKDELY
jgi:hypothetical protein